MNVTQFLLSLLYCGNHDFTRKVSGRKFGVSFPVCALYLSLFDSICDCSGFLRAWYVEVFLYTWRASQMGFRDILLLLFEAIYLNLRHIMW